jgi:hypothetical protein
MKFGKILGYRLLILLIVAAIWNSGNDRSSAFAWAACAADHL